MADKIYKYGINPHGRIKIRMHMAAVILTAQLQNGLPQIWVKTPEDLSEDVLRDRTVIVIGTGWDIPADAERYIATYQQGPFVWHVYEGPTDLFNEGG